MTTEERRKYDRDWYHKNKERIGPKKNEKQRKRSEKRKELVLDYLKSHPCIDCGENDPVVLEFDHRDSNLKLMNISNLMTGQYSEKIILEEIAKCDVRCANCHRIRTYKRFNSYRLDLKDTNLA